MEASWEVEMSIRILDEKTYSQIAAGEVIERPSSIVRELVDNSLDAEAKKIDVLLTMGEDDIEIEVRDDGFGIDKGDLPLAIKKHATSKISSFEDIFNLQTLGFRGEALAAVSSISHMQITSSRTTDGKAYKMIAKAMEVEDIVASMRDRGTSVKIRNVFYNTPVRLKFLKSFSAEKADVKREIVSKILSSKNVGFTYQVIKDGRSREEINIPASFELKDKIYYLFGKSIYDSLVEIQGQYGEADERIWVEGYATDQKYRGKLKRDQYFFLFGRQIENNTLSKAFNSVYVNLLPSKTMAACFLNVTLPKDKVDINVHPAKKSAKFHRNEDIYRAVYHVVKDQMYDHIYKRQRGFSTDIPFEVYEKMKQSYGKEDAPAIVEPLEAKKDGARVLKQDFIDVEPQKALFENSVQGQKEERSLLPNIRIHGQMARSYILFSAGNNLYIADQHAVHERINFDRIKEKMETHIEYQILLTPLTIDFPISQIDKVLSLKEPLSALGLEIEPFGEDSIKIEKIPTFLQKEKSASVVKGVIEALMDNSNAKRSDILEKAISTMACRTSIMAGDELGNAQMLELIKELYKGDHVFHCPHGRPAVKEFLFEEIEKFFER